MQEGIQDAGGQTLGITVQGLSRKLRPLAPRSLLINIPTCLDLRMPRYPVCVSVGAASAEASGLKWEQLCLCPSFQLTFSSSLV